MRGIDSHNYPLLPYLGKLGNLLDRICDGNSNFRPIPKYVKEGARQILLLVLRHYPTRGRRLSVIVLTSLGIARGDNDISDLQDLIHRVESMLGEKIPPGQVFNTFQELRTFLRLRHVYKESKKVPRYTKFTSEELRILRFLKRREMFH